MKIKSIHAAPDEVIAAYNHIKELHPLVNSVAYDEELHWHYGIVDGGVIQFTGAEDIGLLNTAAGAQYENPETLPVIYLDLPEGQVVQNFVQHIATWHANVVARLDSLVHIPAEEAITITNHDTGKEVVYSDARDKEIFLKGVLCALTEFATLPIEEASEQVEDANTAPQAQDPEL